MKTLIFFLFIAIAGYGQQRIPVFDSKLTPLTTVSGVYGLAVRYGHLVLVGSTAADTIKIANSSELVSAGTIQALQDTTAALRSSLNGKVDKSTFVVQAKAATVNNGITNGVIDKAPSEDAVFDALALKEPVITGGSAGQFWYYNKTWRTPVIGDITGLQLQLNNTAKPDSANIFTQSNTFNLKVNFLDTYANRQASFGQVGQGGLIAFRDGTAGTEQLFLGYNSATSASSQLLASGSFRVASSGVATNIENTSASGAVNLISSGATAPAINITLGATQRGKWFANGNFVHNPAGTFTDEGYTYDLFGTSRTSGTALFGNLVGIGNTSPSSMSANNNRLVIGDGSEVTGLTLYSSNSTAGNIAFNDVSNGTNIGIIRYEHSDDSFRFFTNSSEKLRITTGGLFGMNTTSPSSTSGGLDIASGGLALIMGADLGASTRTNATTKISRIGSSHYTNAEEPTTIAILNSTSTANTLQFGGGSSLMNAATQLEFYTAANNTTTTGAIRLVIDATGNTTFSGNALPNATNTRDFGSPSLTWNNGYVGNLFTNNLGINANANLNFKRLDGTVMGVMFPSSGSWHFKAGGTYTEAASAIVNIESTTKGLLIPRMTTAERNAISSPAEGLEVYDLTLHKKTFFNGTAWEVVTSL